MESYQKVQSIFFYPSVKPYIVPMKQIYLILGVVFLSLNIQAQSKIISGKITDATTGAPLPLVSVYLKGSSVGTLSNDEGEFFIEVNNQSLILVFSYTGYETQNFGLNNLSSDVKLVPVIADLPEVVVEGHNARYYLDLAYKKITADSAVIWYADAFFRQKNQVDNKKVNEIKEMFYYTSFNTLGVLGSEYKTGRYASEK